MDSFRRGDALIVAAIALNLYFLFLSPVDIRVLRRRTRIPEPLGGERVSVHIPARNEEADLPGCKGIAWKGRTVK